VQAIKRIRRRPKLPLLRGLVLLVILGSCASCASSIIEGRPPFIGISAMQLADDKLSADFRIANQNDVAMTIQAIDITITVNEVELVRENRDLQLSIDANSAEEVQVEELPDAFTRDLLQSLERGAIDNLPFSLEGRVRTLEDGYLRFEQKGHLYPVPGKPGSFRSAVTQAQELRREDLR
jgi:hypothetical protein